MRYKQRCQGASKFEFLAIVVLFGILATVLLNRLTYYEAQAEKAQMEYAASTMKSALRAKMALMLIQGKAQDYASLAQQNPLDWLEHGNNAAQIPLAPAGRALAGAWEYDRTQRMLVYWVKHDDDFMSDSSGQKRVRWQVKLVENPTPDPGGPRNLVVGAKLELVEPYRWF